MVSAPLRDGKPETVILWIVAQPDWLWVGSPAILEEYRAILGRKKFNFAPELLPHWSGLPDESIALCEPDIAVDFPRDRKDAKFLEYAKFSHADVFITGDGNCSEAQGFTDAPITSPTGFFIASH